MLRFHTYALLLIALPLTVMAEGGPPLLTDDPGTPGAGRYEINTAFTAVYRNGHHELEAPLVDMNWGITEHGQLKVEIPWVVNGDGSEHESGLGDLVVGGKWRFLDQEQAGVDVSVYPQLAFSPSSRSRSIGLTDQGFGLILPVEVGRDFGRLFLGAEVGHVIQTQNADDSFAGIAVGWKADAKTELVGEYHQEFTSDAEDRQRLVNVGFRRQLSSNVKLLSSVGADLPDASPNPARLFVYLGLQFTD